jgi:hypothetical protein
LLVVLVLAALVGSTYLLLRGPGGGILGSLGGGSPDVAPTAPRTVHPSKNPASRQQPHHPRSVPAIAARHSGGITGVEVQKTGRCRPGALCPVKVTVHFRPVSTAQPIAWKVGAARVCHRGISWSAPTAVTAQAGWSTVYASSSVRIPRGRSLALVALTTTPARAQSRPVPVAGSSLHC